MEDPFIGEIRLFGFEYAPEGWLFCDGQLLSIPRYQALFAVIRNVYGGDGKKDFRVPDLLGRVALGCDDSREAFGIGKQMGADTVKLTESELAPHKHGLIRKATGAPVAGRYDTPNDRYHVAGLAKKVNNNSATSIEMLEKQGIPETALAASTVTAAGSGVRHNNLQPYLELIYCINYTGYFPVT